MTGLLMACSDEIDMNPNLVEDPETELPVEFFMTREDFSSTRTIIDTYGNEKFSNGDVIHVLGQFQTETLQEDGSTLPGTMSRYGALQYDGKNWKALDGSSLTWPSTATTGSFTAYYLSESNGILTGTNPTVSYSLSDLTVKTDPLMAVSEPNIPYGNGVKMQFSHLCARLTLLDMEPQVSGNYWFTRDDDITRPGDTGIVTPFHNAFQLALGTGTDGPTLEFSFIENPDKQFENLVYIGGTVNVPVDESGNPLNEPPTVEYFLEPGLYDNFKLVYPASAPTYYDYLKYSYKKPEEGEESPVPMLMANTPYTLNITKSQGIIISVPTSSTGWDESDDSTIIVDVEEFLKSIYEGKEYSQDNTPILITPATNVVELTRNVSFNDFNYEKLNGFLPDVPENITFDGGKHYIQGMVDPLFHYNYGTIRNLGIRSSQYQITSYESANENLDNSRNGALCHMNSGIINNIRERDMTLTVAVQSEIRPGMDGSETHNIGGLVGSNTGTISDVEFGSNITITVQGLDERDYLNNVNASVLIGGVAGQNAGSGIIKGVSEIQENPVTIRITNKCIGPLGEFTIGGLVGQSSADIIDVTLNSITVNSTQSQGVVTYVGGMVGELSNPEDGYGILDSCSISGTVRAGSTRKNGDIPPRSYIGGIAGAVTGITVSNCRSSARVYGSVSQDEDVVYGTGGAFGRIRNNGKYDFTGIIAYGSTLTGPAEFIGSFAGIAPVDDEWENWMKTDYPVAGILLNNFPGINEIGTNLAD